MRGPEPEGLSGSGVWQLTASRVSDKLVAMVIEHSDNFHALISTRLDRYWTPSRRITLASSLSGQIHTELCPGHAFLNPS